MAAVAELEVESKSSRKAPLAAAKARDMTRGNPNGASTLKGKQVDSANAVATIKAMASLRGRPLCDAVFHDLIPVHHGTSLCFFVVRDSKCKAV